MGYYIQGPTFGKAQHIVDTYEGKFLESPPKRYEAIPADKALIVIVSNAIFEAAGFAYDADEFAAFTDPTDPRHRSYVLIDRAVAERVTGYKK